MIRSAAGSKEGVPREADNEQLFTRLEVGGYYEILGERQYLGYKGAPNANKKEKSLELKHDVRGLAYQKAQRAIADLKSAIYDLLSCNPEGLKNAEIGKQLGIYMGHSGEGRHLGHIPRTLLEVMAAEGTVERNVESKLWTLKSKGATADDG